MTIHFCIVVAYVSLYVDVVLKSLVLPWSIADTICKEGIICIYQGQIKCVASYRYMQSHKLQNYADLQVRIKVKQTILTITTISDVGTCYL